MSAADRRGHAQPSHALHARMDAVLRQQHLSKPVLDLLQTLVANCVDTDAFKQSTGVRLGVVEGLVRQPTSEISAARAETAAALEAMQRNVETLEKKFRATYDALRGEADLRIAEITEAARCVAEEAGLARRDAQHAFARHVDALRHEARDVLAVELANTKKAAADARDHAVDTARQRLEALQVSTVEETAASLSELASDATRGAEQACDAARAELTAKLNEADARVSATVADATRRLGGALDTINALPLLEVHRLGASVALLEARVDIIDAAASNARVDGMAAIVSDVQRRAARCELREEQLNDKLDALAAEVAGDAAPSARAALAPAALSSPAASSASFGSALSPAASGTASRRAPPAHLSTSALGSPRAGRMRDEDRRRSVRALADDVDFESTPLFSTPSPTRRRAHVSDAPQQPQQQQSNSLRTMLRLQSRLDALEGSTLEARHSGEQAIALVRRMGTLLDESVVTRVAAVDDAVAALFATLGLDRGRECERHRQWREDLEQLDACIARAARRHGRKSAALSTTPEGAALRQAARRADGASLHGGDDDDSDDALMLERMASELRFQLESSRVLWSAPPFAAHATPLPALGVELAEGGPPLGGVVVVGVVPDGAGDDAGLRPDDVVLRVGETPVSDREAFAFAARLAAAASSSKSTRARRHGDVFIPLVVFRPDVGSVVSVELQVHTSS